jgi:hypothetical protein
MSIYDEFLAYRDDDGLNQLTTKDGKGVPTQNGTLFTVEYLICLVNDPNTENSVKWAEIRRITDVFRKLEKEYGLTQRTSTSKEVGSMDNETALLTFSALFAFGNYAERVFNRGSGENCMGYEQESDKTLYWLCKILNFGHAKYFWNVTNPDKFSTLSWFGRSPAFMGLLKMTSNKWCNPVLWLSVLAGQFLGCASDPNNTDARTLSYIIWQYLNTRSFVWRSLYKLWCWQLLRVYPNGMQEVYKQYYLQDPNHPIIKYSKKY